MGTVLIGTTLVPLPQKYLSGQEMDDVIASMLNDIRNQRTMAKLRYLFDRGEINADNIQAKALEIQSEPLRYVRGANDLEDEKSDPILEEALGIARELIISRMAKEGLPPPKGLDTHAKALVEAMPQIYERARLRIEAKYRTANEAMEALQ